MIEQVFLVRFLSLQRRIGNSIHRHSAVIDILLQGSLMNMGAMTSYVFVVVEKDENLGRRLFLRSSS